MDATLYSPLQHLNGIAGYKHLYVKDESVHPNGTFKDRLSRKALEQYPSNTILAVISYGNTAISLARLVAESNASRQAGYQVIVFVPKGFENWSFGPSSQGTTISAEQVLAELKRLAHIISYDSTSQVFRDEDLRTLAVQSGFDGKNFVNLTEGLSVSAYVDIIKEVVSQLGRAPDVCVVPFGAGILCNEIKDYLDSIGHGSVIPLSVAAPSSLARMLYGPIWVDTEELRRAGSAFSRHVSPDRTGAVRHPYPVFLVREEEILDGLEIAKNAGISAEPSGAAGLGILRRLKEIHPRLDPDWDLVVVINTGNGIDGFLKNRKHYYDHV